MLYTHHDKKVWILIDEYDAPLQQAFNHQYYDAMVNFLRNLLGNALKDNEYLHKAAKDLEVYFRDKVDVMKIFEFKEFFRAHIQSEKTLFCFLSKRAGVNEGVNSIMSFFMYNFQGPASTLLHTRGSFFIKDIKIQVKREIQQLSLPSHHSKKKQEALF